MVNRRAAFLVYFDDEIHAMFRYDPSLIDEIKDAIPYGRRYWNSDRGVWIIDGSERDAFSGVLQGHGYEPYWLITEEEHRIALAMERSKNADRTSLGILDTAPWELVDAAYRVMARLYHPDVSGRDTTEKMKEINIAYDRLQKQRPKR